MSGLHQDVTVQEQVDAESGGERLVRRAIRDESDLVLDMLTEAAVWQSSRGEPVWPIPFPRATVERSIARGETYLLLEGRVVVGTVALSWDDPLWDEDRLDAGYVHRLAVSRHRSGDGLGEFMLAWVARQIGEAGRIWLRLDCPSPNCGLRAYYERRGFELVRETDVTSPPEFGACVTWHLAFLQRRV